MRENAECKSTAAPKALVLATCYGTFGNNVDQEHGKKD